jgi:tetratricopeptide (TPR) repeat protein
LRQPISEEEVETLRAEASAAARQSGDARLGALVSIAHRFVTSMSGGELSEAIDDVGEALATATRLGDRALAIAAHCVLASAHTHGGALDAVVREAGRGLELFEGFRYRPPGVPFFVNRGLLLNFRAGALMRSGRLDEAARDFEENLRLSSEGGELTAVALAYGFAEELAAVQGDTALALSRALRAQEAAAAAEATSVSVLSDLRLGRSLLLVGDARQAAEVLERSVALLRSAQTMGAYEALALGSLARAHALLGDPRAREESQGALRLLASRASSDAPGVCLERARALRLLDGAGASEEIEAALAEGERLARARGDRSSLPFLHEERAELARLLGDEVARERELREARRLFAEIGAPLQVERLARELAAQSP